VISAEDVRKVKGEAACPAELKKQIEELKTDLEKKIHTVEQSKLFNRTLILMLIAGFVTLIFTVFIKPYFDGRKDIAQAPVAVQPADIQPVAPAVGVADGEKVIALPAHLGFYIFGAGAIAGACVIGAALIIRMRKS
jgi:hypothetical protein